MTTPEKGSELKPNKEFDRADCIWRTVRAFSPQLPSLGQGIEARYIPGNDVYRMPNEHESSVRIHSLDNAVSQRISQFKDPGVDLTDEKLEELKNQGWQAKLDWGNAVVTRARELELVKTLTYQAESGPALPPNVNLKKEVGSRNIFRLGGLWGITRDDNDKPTLLVLIHITPIVAGEKQQRFFETVNLDDLHERDPEFLPRQIRDFEVKQVMSLLAGSITAELATELKFHKIHEEELLPGYMRRLSGIVNPEQRAKEMQSIPVFLSLLVKLGHDYDKLVHNFQQEMYNRKSDAGSRGSVWIDSYLGHMAECSAQSTVVRGINAELLSAYRSINNHAVFNHVVSDEQQTENSDVIKLLQTIAKNHPVGLEVGEKRWISRREQVQKVVDFIDKTKDIVDRAKFLQVLSQDLPEFHSTLVKFREWLGNDYSQRGNFDMVVLDTARTISEVKKPDIKQLGEVLEKKLGTAVPVSGKFEGVSVEGVHFNERAGFDNQDLQAVLLLMVIKTAQAEAKGKKDNSSYNEQFQHCQALTLALKESHEEENKSTDALLANIAEEKKALSLLQAQTGIADREITHLIQLTKGEDKGDGLGPELDSSLFAGLLTALVLEKQGVVNTRSPVFKELLKSLFPGKPEATWQKLY